MVYSLMGISTSSPTEDLETANLVFNRRNDVGDVLHRQFCVSLVSSLSEDVGPSAVVGGIASIHVGSVKAHAVWAGAHIDHKGVEAGTPAVTHGYASGSVMRKRFVVRVVAPVYGTRPSVEKNETLFGVEVFHVDIIVACVALKDVVRCIKSLQRATWGATLHKTLRCAATKPATQRNVVLKDVAVLRRSGGGCSANMHFVADWNERAGMEKHIALNDRGRRIGEGHPRAKLLDREVEQVLALLATGMSYAAVAEKFDVSKSCIAHIASGRRRSQAIETVRRVSV